MSSELEGNTRANVSEALSKLKEIVSTLSKLFNTIQGLGKESGKLTKTAGNFITAGSESKGKETTNPAAAEQILSKDTTNKPFKK